MKTLYPDITFKHDFRGVGEVYFMKFAKQRRAIQILSLSHQKGPYKDPLS